MNVANIKTPTISHIMVFGIRFASLFDRNGVNPEPLWQVAMERCNMKTNYVVEAKRAKMVDGKKVTETVVIDGKEVTKVVKETFNVYTGEFPENYKELIDLMVNGETFAGENFYDCFEKGFRLSKQQTVIAESDPDKAAKRAAVKAVSKLSTGDILKLAAQLGINLPR